MSSAYDDTFLLLRVKFVLKTNHVIFQCLVKNCPTWSKIWLMIMTANEDTEGATARELVPVVARLKDTIAEIDKLYLDNGLDLEVPAPAGFGLF